MLHRNSKELQVSRFYYCAYHPKFKLRSPLEVNSITYFKNV